VLARDPVGQAVVGGAPVSTTNGVTLGIHGTSIGQGESYKNSYFNNLERGPLVRLMVEIS
jgi:hypothetical protein